MGGDDLADRAGEIGEFHVEQGSGLSGSGDPGDSIQATRIPLRPSSLASCLLSPASADQATWEPPSLGIASRPPPRASITPPRPSMWRALTVAMLKWVAMTLLTGRAKSVNSMSSKHGGFVQGVHDGSLHVPASVPDLLRDRG